MPTVGSLFSGIGLLDIGLHLAGWQHAWMCESDPWRRGMLVRRFGVPVYDDVRTVGAAPDAASAGCKQCAECDEHSDGLVSAGRDAERRGVPLGGLCAPAAVDLIAGGFPCKGASTAGKREGFEHAETVLWHEMRRVIGALQPRYVLIENVANILGMAASPSEPPGSLWGTVLADLAALGFDVVWDCVPAAAVGAPHLRDRVFAIATNTGQERRGEPARQPGRRIDEARRRQDLAPIAEPAPDANGSRSQGHGSTVGVRPQVPGVDRHDDRASADAAWNGEGGPSSEGRTNGQRTRSRADVAVDWGQYAPAIRRWEAIHGPAPEPLVRRLDDGDPVLRRVRARVDRSRLSALGDGVHVYVGWLVGQYVMELERQRLAA